MRQIEEGRFAVMRFSGRTSDRMERDTLKQLQEWIGDKHTYDREQKPMYGYFDPPWTLGMFRRNEVMLRL